MGVNIGHTSVRIKCGVHGGFSQTDELWMVEALREAQRALEYGEVPVGAVVRSSRLEIVRRGCESEHHGTAIPTATCREWLPCARQVLRSEPSTGRTAICLLQLNPAPCAPARMIHAR